MTNEIFDSSYVDQSSKTEPQTTNSQMENFLKNPVEEKAMTKYGTSKPNRIVIKAKIKNG